MAAEHQNTGGLLRYLDYRPVDNTTNRRIAEFSLILAALFLLDIFTTQVILRLGGIELNPVMAGVVASPAIHIVLKSATLLLIIVVSLIAEKEVRGSSVIFYCVLITLYIFVFVNNVFVMLPQLLLHVLP
jgi:hypothetical protein